MNGSEPTSSGDLAGQVAALQRQVFTLLLALVVVSGTLVTYLFYESYHLGNETAKLKSQVIEPYNQKLPAIQSFVNQLVAYGQGHPDFRPILFKYGIIAPLPATNPPSKPAPVKK